MPTYLEKQAFTEQLLTIPPDVNLGMVIVIPCYKEPNLTVSLQALLDCAPPKAAVEVLVVINAAEVESQEVLQQNQQTVEDAEHWIKERQGTGIKFHLLRQENLPPKTAGVGLARKIGMDEAVRRLELAGKEDGIIVCFDADATCSTNYLVELEKLFERENCKACSIHFEHPLEGTAHNEETYQAITSYELFLRYYLQGLRYAGHPFAFHTIGSSMAVRSLVYQRQGGMNKRKAGEDFYFLQKVIPLGDFYELTAAKVFPSPRPSDRVPFGTGKAVNKILEEGNVYKTYSVSTFVDLKNFMDKVDDLYEKYDAEMYSESIVQFLESYSFSEKWKELKSNTSNQEAFKKRFFQWFDGFMVLKYVHFSRDHFYPEESILKTANDLLQLIGESGKETERELLRFYRELEIKNPRCLSEDFRFISAK